MCLFLFIASISLSALAQRIRVGYDKGTDFVTSKTFSWEQPGMPVTSPLLFEKVVGSVDMDLKDRGLARVERDGDLLLIPAGAMEFGPNVAAGTPILPTYEGRSPRLMLPGGQGLVGRYNLWLLMFQRAHLFSPLLIELPTK